MPLSHLAIIPCPTGKTSSGKHRVSVFLVPRLREAGNLADYPVWAQWGTNVDDLRFQAWEGNTPRPGFTITRTSAAVNPAFWQAVFGANVPTLQDVVVRASAFIDRSTTDFTGMDGAGLAAATESMYKELARLGAAGATASEVQASFFDNQAGDAIVDAAPYFAQIGNGLEPDAPDVDFHEALKLLSAHPALMRALGLIIDLEVDTTSSPTPVTEIQLRSNFPGLVPGGGADFTSREQIPYRMEVDGAGLPLPALGAYRTGRWVNFGSNKFAVNQGGSAQYAASLERVSQSLAGAEADAPFDLPAIEEAGLRVIHKEVVAMVASQVNRAKSIEDKTDLWLKGGLDPETNQPVEPPKIRGEDATLGIRWDVKDNAKGAWRSLHRRQNDGVTFPRNGALTLTPAPDEGWWSLAVMTDGTFTSNTQSTAAFYVVQEGADVTRFRHIDTTDWRISADFMLWAGWSLSAKRPGESIDKSGTIAAVDPSVPQPGDPAQAVVAPYEVVPGSLERLRFSHTYRFRGRYVDLCGNSEAYTATEPSGAVSPAVNYGRTVPVPAPTVVRRQSRPIPGTGDYPTTVVIKSELTTPNKRVKKSSRVVFPPRISQNRLERHGLPAADGIDANDYKLLKDRDAVVLADQLLVDPLTGELVAGAAIKSGRVTLGPVNQAVAYLADPAAHKIAFNDVPHGTGTFAVSLGGWPARKSVTLELIAGSQSPSIDATNRTLTVSLAKSEQQTMQVSCAIDPAFLSHFKWYLDLDPADQAAIESAMKNGKVSLFTPPVPVLLVHAVRIPLSPPGLKDFTGGRAVAGQTTISINGQVNLHQDSSDRMVVRAVWSAPDYSSLGGLGVNAKGGSGIVLDAGVPRGEGNVEFLTNVRFDLGDTRRHTVRLTATAYSRFSEYFTQRRVLSLDKGVPVTLASQGLAEGMLRLYRAANNNALDLAENYDVDYTAGTVTAKNSSPLANGTAVYFDFVRLPVARNSSEAKAGQRFASFEIPSSAAPAAPEVVDLLPGAQRTQVSTASKITVTHDGRLVRALLTPPWNSSGQGELLGVALAADGSQTRWGRDATAASLSPTAQPTLSDAKNTSETAANIDGLFDVAAYPVTYDADRNLITGDVLLNAPGYRPFVQLSLCRYQPLSVAGQHVSTTVKPAVLRLGAPRLVTAKLGASHQVTVTLKGPDNVNQVTVHIEDADPDVDDADLKWRTAASSVVLTRSGTIGNATHTGVVTLPVTGTARRLVIEDAEPVSRQVGASLVAEYDVAYREVIEIPAAW